MAIVSNMLSLIHRRRLYTLLDELRPRLFRLAMSWTHSREVAEDLVQDCFTRAVEKISSVRDDTRLEIWVTRILSNLYLDQVRRKTPAFIDADVDMLENSDPGPEQIAQQIEASSRIELALQSLDTETQQVITLVDIAGYRYSECADILDIPIGTVMSRVSRGREKLLKQIKQMELDRGTHQNVIHIRRSR